MGVKTLLMVDFEIEGIKLYCDYDKDNTKKENEQFALSFFKRCLNRESVMVSLEDAFKKKNPDVVRSEVVYILIDKIADFYCNEKNSIERIKYVNPLKNYYVHFLGEQI